MTREAGWPGGSLAWRTPLLTDERIWGRIGTAIVYGVTLGFLSVFAYLVLYRSPTRIDLAFGWILPVMEFAALLHFDRRVVPTASAPHLVRVATWFLAGATFFTIVIAGTLELLVLKGGQVVNPEFVILVFAGGGSVFGYVMGVYDVDRKREAERAERLHTQASVLNRVLRHDIRNDATVIQGYVDLLGEEASVDEETVETIENRVDDIVSLSETARKLERVMAVDDESTTEFSLATVVDEQASRVDEAYPSVSLTAETDEPVRVKAHDLLPSAIYNVVSNAAEHNDADEPTVAVAVESVDDRWARVRVADNGPGIPAEEREVLKRGTESALNHSNGLGLWLVNWIVRRSDGALDIRSREPRGSEVVLYFERVGVS
ncbi:MAG: ATP-binding protein [Halanaeroarchaeum sp.]